MDPFSRIGKNPMAQLPRARRSGLIVEVLPDELLVYDSDRDVALCLNQAAAAVWKHCDGQTTPERIALLIEKEFQVSAAAEVVSLALERLGECNLLATKTPFFCPGVSRRELVRRIGIAAALVPVITLILVPTASAQATCGVNGSRCVADADCCSNNCVDNGRGVFQCT